MGEISCPRCTFKNPENSLQCSMCYQIFESPSPSPIDPLQPPSQSFSPPPYSPPSSNLSRSAPSDSLPPTHTSSSQVLHQPQPQRPTQPQNQQPPPQQQFQQPQHQQPPPQQAYQPPYQQYQQLPPPQQFQQPPQPQHHQQQQYPYPYQHHHQQYPQQYQQQYQQPFPPQQQTPPPQQQPQQLQQYQQPPQHHHQQSQQQYPYHPPYQHYQQPQPQQQQQQQQQQDQQHNQPPPSHPSSSSSPRHPSPPSSSQHPYSPSSTPPPSSTTPPPSFKKSPPPTFKRSPPSYARRSPSPPSSSPSSSSSSSSSSTSSLTPSSSSTSPAYFTPSSRASSTTTPLGHSDPDNFMRGGSSGSVNRKVRVGGSSSGAFLNKKFGSASGKIKRKKNSLARIIDYPSSDFVTRNNGVAYFEKMEKGGFVPHKHFTEEEKIGGVFGSGKRRAVPGLATSDVSVRASPVISSDSWQEFFDAPEEELEEFVAQPQGFLKIQRNCEHVACSLHYSNCALFVGEKRIGLENIEMILIGPESAVMQRYAEKSSAKGADVDYRLYITIKHSHMKSLDLIAPSTQVVGKWTAFLMRKVPVIKSIDITKPYLNYFFEDYLQEKKTREKEEEKGKGREEEVNVQDVLYLFFALNYYPMISDVREMVGTVDRNQDGRINFEEWYELIQNTVEYPLFNSLFEEFSTQPKSGLVDWKKMNAEEFSSFLIQVQGEKMADKDWAQQMIAMYDGSASLSQKTFSKYLLCGKVNGPFDPLKEQVFHDMTRPLNEYFIASSHNTYLETDQLVGLSSIDMYMRVLETGCRCVEIDVWDGKDGVPLITHGGTLCTRIDAFATLTAIRKSAFTTSPFPVIISIENHCCPEQQVILANMMKTVFEGSLPPPFDKGMSSLPSPASLQFQILLKGNDSYVKEFREILHLLTKKLKVPKGRKSERGTREVWQMMSVSEAGVAGYEDGVLERYNERCLSRVYPAGKRVASSNYGPMNSWKKGCQLVALNYQAPGIPMLLNLSVFAQNGMCGYVLKPKWMRGGGKEEEEREEDEQDEVEGDEGEVEVLRERLDTETKLEVGLGQSSKAEDEVVLGREGLGLYISGANWLPISRDSCGLGEGTMYGGRTQMYESMAGGGRGGGIESQNGERDWLSCDPSYFWARQARIESEKEKEHKEDERRSKLSFLGGGVDKSMGESSENSVRMSGGSFLYETVCSFDYSSPKNFPSQVRICVGVCGGRFLPRPRRGLFKDGYVSAERVVQRGKVIFNSAINFAQRVAKGGEYQGVSPYVSVKVLGVADEEKQTTSVVQNNGLNPHWNESFNFEITCSEMSMMQFSVYHKAATNVILGSFIVPVSALRPGYRVISLLGEDNILLPLSTLLIHLNIEKM